MDTKILKIVSHSIYYTQKDFISFKNSNFPDLEHFKFKSHINIYWEVEIKEYDSINKVLVLNIIDYESSKVEEFELQRKNKVGLEKIHFNDLQWNKLESQFINYRKSAFKDIVNEDSLNKSNNPIYIEKKSHEPTEESYNKFKPESLKKVSEGLIASIKFKDATFINGGVKFYIQIYETQQKQELEISNNEILMEFDFIKNFFPRLFKRKTFDVFGTIIIENNKTNFENISSPQITQINSSIIEQVKQFEFNRITKLTSQKEGKELYNLNEIFDELAFPLKTATFTEDERGLINFFLKDKYIKNKQQLVYLSGLKHTSQNRIKFTLKPYFGFLFSINGNDKSHYCWELLDSHATYLWSIPNNFKNKIEIIEENISLIKKIGRQNYKNQINNENSSHLDSALFNLIRHSNTKNGFIEWKEQLNSLTK